MSQDAVSITPDDLKSLNVKLQTFVDGLTRGEQDAFRHLVGSVTVEKREGGDVEGYMCWKVEPVTNSLPSGGNPIKKYVFELSCPGTPTVPWGTGTARDHRKP